MDRHVSSLDEASFAIAGDLMKLAQTEGRLPRITGIHSIVPIGDGEVSIGLLLMTRMRMKEMEFYGATSTSARC